MRAPVLMLALAAVGSPPAEAPPALTAAAIEASRAERYCEALALFEASNARWPSPRALYNAAEVANAAGDRWRAVELYREAQRFYPSYERRGVMQKRLDELGRRIATEGPGAACPRVPNRCGDWRLEGAETCDDGNTTDGDGCDANCRETGCGNGVLTAGELCDDGNLVSGDGCDANCTLTACGNGVRTPGEECDDGNAIDGDGCDANCTVTACGNGVRTAGEECDDGNARDGDGCDEGCFVTRCGNGVLTRGEECDDGNAIDGDGCEHDCRVTRVRAPLPGLAVVGGGVAASLASVVLFWSAGDVWANHELAVDTVEKAQRDYERGDERALRIVDDAHERERETRAQWEGWGRVAVGAGAGLATFGVAALVGGTWWALTRTEELVVEEIP